MLSNAEGGVFLKDSVRDRIIESYRNELNERIDQMYGEDSYQRILHSTPQIRGLLTPLGLDMEQSDLFTDSLRRVLCAMPQETLCRQVNDSIILYREIFADLGMCIALNLNQFGYLRVLSGGSSMCENDDFSYSRASLQLERALIVCQTLADGDGLDAEGLQKLFRQHFDSVINEVHKHMSDDGYQTLLQEFPVDDAEYFYGDDGNGFGDLHGMPFSYGTFKAWILPNTPMDDIWLMFRKLQSIWNLVQFIVYFNTIRYQQYAHSLRGHYAELYRVMRAQWKRTEEDAPMADMIDCIGCAYNDPSQSAIAENDLSHFKVSLAFVLYYYYHSWNTYGQFSLLDVSDIDRQIDILMGGDGNDAE